MAEVEAIAAETDELLVERARRGGREAETALVLRLYPGVHALASHMLRHREAARDATQDAFLRAFSRLEQFDGAHRFSAWVFRILVNLIRDLRRREGLAPTVEVEPDALSAAAPLPAEALVREEQLQRARAAIAELPEEMRLAVLLHYQEGLSGPEVAFALGLTPQAARLKICRGLARIRARMSEDA